MYHETEELRLRAKVDEFEIATRATGHDWALFDLTDSFPNWLASQRYAKSYFQKPNLLSTLLPKYLSHILSAVRRIDGVFDVYRTTGSQRRP